MDVVDTICMAAEPAAGLYIIRAINESNASAAVVTTLAHCAGNQANKTYRIEGSEPVVNTTNRQAPGLCFRSAVNVYWTSQILAEPCQKNHF